jgi:hypothetical protein
VIALTNVEREQITEDYRRDPKHYGSVEFALSREIGRLRRLAERVNPPEPEQDWKQ